jgi:S-adenosylmethionine:tRNA ribosyltransferase-isomerase
METADFAYNLPREKIAQHPVEPRDASMLLVLHRESGAIEHRHFRDIGDYLRRGDILVANDSRVYPARLYGEKQQTGGRVELLLLERLSARQWRALVGGRRLVEDTIILLHAKDGSATDIQATIRSELDGPERVITFNSDLDDTLSRLGHTPLPPYIHTRLEDSDRYQTVYSRHHGSAAAPTAGLHFTADLLIALREKGIYFETCTLHIGLDTFKPVTAREVSEHAIHSESASLSAESARRINQAKLAGGRIIAVGTTTARVLETAALRSAGIAGSLQDISARDARGETSDICPWKPVAAFSGRTDLFIYPGYRFRAVDALITNFHLPQSSLLMMVSAFASRRAVLDAYDVAIAEDYRFYSFGDAMLLL